MVAPDDDGDGEDDVDEVHDFFGFVAKVGDRPDRLAAVASAPLRMMGGLDAETQAHIANMVDKKLTRVRTYVRGRGEVARTGISIAIEKGSTELSQ